MEVISLHRMGEVYCWPKFGKGLLGRGMGFGNRLFPWARCRIFAHLHGARMISPVWVRPAIGQIYRGGIDYRNYLHQLVLLGLFRQRRGDAGLVRGALEALRIPGMDEPDDLTRFERPDPAAGGSLVVFRKLRRHFHPLTGWSGFLRDELTAITRPRFIELAARFPSVPIGLCIRCGNDFDPAPTDRDVLRPGEKTPIPWFVDCLRLIREAAGHMAQAYIVSDGTPRQLADLLRLENVHLVRPGSAISDLLVISRSRVLLASGSSSFAAWASFLGQMPTASHPGQPVASTWEIEPERGQVLTEFDPRKPDDRFLGQAAEVLREFRASGPTSTTSC